jgi:HK97 family phage major capsid protein
MNLEQLRADLRRATADARAICEKATGENRMFTAEERSNLVALKARATELKGQIDAATGDSDLVSAVMQFSAGAGDGGQDRGAAGKGRSIGEAFVESEAWKSWFKLNAPSGVISDSRKGLTSPAIEYKTLITGDSVTSAGAFVQTDYTGIYEPMGRRPLTVRDLVATRRTGTDLVEFVRQTAKVTQAAPVAEANVTEYTGATGQVSGVKPEGAMAFEKVQTGVKTIAVWIPATKRSLSDAAQIRGIIDQELSADLEEELEDQLLSGDGTGENLTGILNTANVLEQDWETDLVTTTRKAITTLRVDGRTRPTAWLLNPADWERFDLLKDGDNRYYWGGPLTVGQRTLWGIPVVESEAMTEGVAVLADWRKAVLWDRERASIQVSDSHEDFFIRNMVAFLAEMRAAFGIIRPSAFCIVDLLATS